MKQLIDVSDGSVLLESVEIADSFWTRFWGLQFRPPISKERGIFLTPCSSLHTFFMRFPIDVVMLDANLLVLSHRRNVRPWRLVFCPKKTSSVIETGVDALPEMTGKYLGWQ